MRPTQKCSVSPRARRIRVNEKPAYEFLGLARVHDLDVRLASLVDDLEGEMLHIGLSLDVVELAAEARHDVEDGVVGDSLQLGSLRRHR